MKDWHVINSKGEHITIPDNSMDNPSQAEDYQLDVEWYQNHGYVTLEQHNMKIEAIKADWESGQYSIDELKKKWL